MQHDGKTLTKEQREIGYKTSAFIQTVMDLCDGKIQSQQAKKQWNMERKGTEIFEFVKKCCHLPQFDNPSF
ncbi:MAG: hypothetical protein EZS28_012055 [Streblomastix strix]|uniref:Uncharacterized protein n=1 Tax=Streblomastix strix TaxID=222440 RepID=A0A5J4WCP5_9EUKA|nr:MAG: hypothetical protein EZS28_012055 [Streblomastix strix]